MPEYSVAEIAARLNDRIVDLARELLGEPNRTLSTRSQLRFGSKGSIAVEIAGKGAGLWFDHERDIGGDGLELIRHRLGLANGAALDWARDWLGQEGEPKPNNGAARPSAGREEKADKPGKVAGIVAACEDPHGTRVETYLRGRAITARPLPLSIRYLANAYGRYRAMVALATDAGGEVHALQLIYLTEDGRKAPLKVQKRTNKAHDGWAEISAVRLPGGLPLVLCEGVETALSIWQSTGQETWACLGIANIARAPVPQGASVVIARDGDNPGSKADQQLRRSVTILRNQGREVAVSAPPVGLDFNDILQRDGEQAVRDLIAAAQAVDEFSVIGSDLAMFDRTEDGIALAFTETHKGDLRFCHHVGKWYVWTGTRWQKEETRLAFNWARKVCRDLNIMSDTTLAKASTAAAVERFAQADRAFAVISAIWDADPFLLGTPVGVVDLRNGMLRPATRQDYITKQAAVGPDPQAGRPLWNRFLAEATLRDAGLQRFLQQVAGYCLTGDVREHALFFVYGPGGNGKSVFLNVLAGVMGDYATTAAMDTFTASVTDKHPTDLAMLQGARMVSASETEEGRAWAESRIKQMTGGDSIRARFMRQDFFEYRPQFKLVIVGNHKPVLRNVDDAAKRRFNIIPFVHKPQAPDRQLEDKLKSEWPAILAWAIEGAIDWQKNGLMRPAVVAEATNEYFTEQDSVRQWVEECCETGGRNLSDTTSALFASWSAYAQANGEKSGTTKWLSQVLQRQGFEPVAETPGYRKKRGFVRITVKPVDTSDQWQNRSDGGP